MNRRHAPYVIVILATMPTAAVADQPAAAIWEERATLAQPFDQAPFRPIRVPAWVRGTLGVGYTLSGQDFAARERATKHGVTLSELGFVDPFYAYYDSKLLHRRNPGVPLDRLPRDIAGYKKLGVRILGVYPPCLQGEVYATHPEWRRVETDTTEIPSIDLEKFPHGGMLCLLGPYGDFFIDVLAEILTMFPDVDAFSFDGLHYAGFCYCKNCRDAYRADTGQEMPKVDMNDPAFRRYQHWADRRMEDLVRRMQSRLKAIKPTVALVTWSTNAGRFGHFLSIPRNMPSRMNLLLDAPDQEFWLDETNRGATVVPAFANAYIWATTNHRVAFSEPYLMTRGNPYGKDSFPEHEILRRMLLAATHGAVPSIAVGQPPRLQDAVYRCMDELQKRKPYLLNRRPLPWAALLMSDNTRNFYGRSAGQVEERYLASVFGMYRAVLEGHLPVTLVNDWNLTDQDLEPYSVLLLPNTASLDDTQAAAIRRFVARGGGLVASLDTGMFDEYGDARSAHALGEVLGVDHLGAIIPSQASPTPVVDVNFAKALTADYWEKRKGVFDVRIPQDSPLRNPSLDRLVDLEPVTFKGPAVRLAPRVGSGTVAIATFRPKETPSAPELPAVLRHDFENGRTITFAAGLDAGFYLYGYPYERILLRNAIQAVAPRPAPVQVVAPMCVHATMMTQKDEAGTRWIVNLYNDMNTTAFHGLPSDDVPLREEVLPIFNVEVTFGPECRLLRAHLEPEGLDLPVHVGPLGSAVRVPRLEVQSMVVAEIDPASAADSKTGR